MEGRVAVVRSARAISRQRVRSRLLAISVDIASERRQSSAHSRPIFACIHRRSAQSRSWPGAPRSGRLFCRLHAPRATLRQVTLQTVGERLVSFAGSVDSCKKLVDHWRAQFGERSTICLQKSFMRPNSLP